MHRPFTVLLGASLALSASTASAFARTPSPQDGPDPAEVRRVAEEAGLAPLSDVPIPRPGNLSVFLNPGARARQSLVILGKALFWDMQVGSDGQACASCHFHAGADNRTKNQISPGLKHTDPDLQEVFDPTSSGGAGGPNYELTADDYPFYRLLVPDERNFDERVVLFETDDVVSSQGVFKAQFEGLNGSAADSGTPLADGTFQVGGVNTRRVEPRNTPTMINAVFNFANFWDGRAHNVFNGASVIGPLDPDARIHVLTALGLQERKIEIPNSSLASQAVGPPLSSEEMSFLGRTLPEVGRKLLGLRPLGLQLVHPRDSVLGPLARTKLGHTGNVLGNPGLDTTYRALIQAAFRPIYWISNEDVDGFTQMEANFSLFFGLAIQAYESTLVSDETPFDEFMEGDDEALEPEQLLGLLAFIRRIDSTDPIFTPEIGVGNCVACHAGPEFTEAAFTSLLAESEDGEPELLEVEEMPELDMGNLVVGEETAFLDVGFSNIGVRPTTDDLGRGAEVNGFPLSFTRQALLGLEFAPELPECGGPDEEQCPEADRVAVDGTFKVPGLRNVALTGPYFHNGGDATLEDVVEFYDRRGNYGDDNIENLERNIARITLTELDEDPLVEFLESLTDPRVAWEMGPFDHPQLFVPNGHAGDHTVLDCTSGIQACDDVLEIPPIGRFGRAAAGLEALEPFLGGGEEEEEEME
jgi:cytochrome c peroxidase